MRPFVDGQPFGEQPLAESAFEEGRLAVQVAAGNGAEEAAEQAGSQFGGEQHRYFAGGHGPGPQACGRALGGTPADACRIGQLAADAVDVIPVVALHLPLRLGDHHAAQAVPGAGVATDETMAVAIDPATLVGVEGGAVGFADALVGLEGRGLADQRLLHRLLGGDGPVVIEVEVRQVAGHQRRIGKARAVVLGGMLGDGQGGRHRLANGVLAARRSAGRALALPDVEGDAEPLVTVEFDCFHFALANGGGQSLLH
ncbi:hypothetical protein D9M68_581600 [compost metagenome]